MKPWQPRRGKMEQVIGTIDVPFSTSLSCCLLLKREEQTQSHCDTVRNITKHAPRPNQHTYVHIGTYIHIWYSDCTTIGSYICGVCGVDLQVKNGVASEIFGRLTQKGSSVVNSPYNILYIVR